MFNPQSTMSYIITATTTATATALQQILLILLLLLPNVQECSFINYHVQIFSFPIPHQCRDIKFGVEKLHVSNSEELGLHNTITSREKGEREQEEKEGKEEERRKGDMV